MKKLLLTGALGQIGTELTTALRKAYGENNVVASDIHPEIPDGPLRGGLYEVVDVVKPKQIADVVKKYQVTDIIHLAALLSAVGEAKPHLAWEVNMGGLFNVLEVARECGAALFTPSSIAAFGPSTPADQTPQDTIQRPTTMYGVTKVAGELLCDYYYLKYGVDTRGVRFPGLISYEALPGGGTTDYAVHIFYEALKHQSYTSYIDRGTYMDMMYMPDAIKATMQLLEADPQKLIHRNAFNVTAMSFDPEALAAEIRQHIPTFSLSYKVDPVRQNIANSWPNSLDDSVARAEWGFKPEYDLAAMTKDMLTQLKIKLKV
ncbi:MAG: putative epimerase/dehydratase [Firmicutes bacterium]|nr:putative epimerase/dehydratase [Bacillota bacterium]MBT9158173.1 putative epimerase/dehydratase [Bacillota bacterium]